jgi:hypothetical protein
MGSSSSKLSGDEETVGSGVTLAPELEGTFNRFDTTSNNADSSKTTLFFLIHTPHIADIVRDFHSKVLQEEWNKFGSSVIIRRNERLQELEQATAQYQHQRHLASISRQQRMEALDTSIDEMQANITDLLVESEYDADKLIQKYGHWINAEIDDPNRESKPLPCLGERAHWIDCQKKYAVDSRPCNFYVSALEQCVQRALFGPSSSSPSDK